jgi:hypothetical protein
LGFKETKEILAAKVTKVGKVVKETKETRGALVLRELKGTKVGRGIKDHRGIRETKVLVSKALVEFRAIRGIKGT